MASGKAGVLFALVAVSVVLFFWEEMGKANAIGFGIGLWFAATGLFQQHVEMLDDAGPSLFHDPDVRFVRGFAFAALGATFLFYVTQWTGCSPLSFLE